MSLDCVDRLCDALMSRWADSIALDACRAHRILVRRYGRTPETARLGAVLAMVVLR